LDEFNRMEVDVLSVVAQHVMTIQQAVAEKAEKFSFDSITNIHLDKSCALFITMNPGYAGRSELPDNLRALFRPMNMVVPDFAYIAEIQLFAEGYQVSFSF
jgi:dynein heavy chain, axonemal